MRLIVFLFLVCIWGSFGSMMAFDANDEYTKAYLEITPRVVRTDVYELLNNLVPELATDNTKKTDLINEYFADNDVTVDAFIDCYKKYLTLDDLKRIKQIEQDETFKKLSNSIAESDISKYLANICEKVANGEELIDIPIPDGKENFFNSYMDFVNLTQPDQQADFTGFFQNQLALMSPQAEDQFDIASFLQIGKVKVLNQDDENVIKANTFAKNNLNKFNFIKIIEGGITEADLKYLKPLITDKTIRQRSKATLEMTRIDMKDLSKKMLEDYRQYLEKKGYQIPQNILNSIQKYFQ